MTSNTYSAQFEQKPSLLKIYQLETRSELLKLLRTPGFTLPSLLFPVMFYLFFGVLFKMSASMPTYLLATYGAFGVIGPAFFSFGVGVAVERGQGWFDLKEVSPMPISGYILARIIVCWIFALMVVILLFSLGATFGDVTLYRSEWIELALILTLGSIPFCAIGLSLGLLLSANSAPAVVNLIYLPMAFLSGLWVPINYFPETLQSIANLLPAYHLSQLALGVLKMDQGQSIWLHVGVLLSYLVAFAWIARWAFNRKDKQ